MTYVIQNSAENYLNQQRLVITMISGDVGMCIGIIAQLSIKI
jgi:hypothetical protein